MHPDPHAHPLWRAVSSAHIETPSHPSPHPPSQISPEIKDLPGAEAYDTANIMVRFVNGKEAIIDVCRQAPYGAFLSPGTIVWPVGRA